jgi:hypothetical protein
MQHLQLPAARYSDPSMEAVLPERELIYNGLTGPYLAIQPVGDELASTRTILVRLGADSIEQHDTQTSHATWLAAVTTFGVLGFFAIVALSVVAVVQGLALRRVRKSLALLTPRAQAA